MDHDHDREEERGTAEIMDQSRRRPSPNGSRLTSRGPAAAAANAANAATHAAPSSTSSSPDLLVNSTSKWKSAWVRFYTTWSMLFGFLFLVYLGHVPLMLLVFVCQVVMFKEIKRLARLLSNKAALPSFRPLHWYWFFVAVIFTYGRLFISYFDIPIPYHAFICFCCYALGVVSFVMSLQNGYYKFQFETFAWVHLTLLIVVVQSSFMVINMFQGLIWFLFPALLIVSNDVWAYVFGFFFGRTPLIQLSPKKTWEGFIGAALVTLITGFLFPLALIPFQALICPKEGFDMASLQCDTPSPFQFQPYELPPFLATALSLFARSAVTHVFIAPVQLHGIVFAAFASVIAPFGGFFASGFKRAFGIKDFGESIPGHGGVTDRMDCQIMMGLFVYVYYWSFIAPSTAEQQQLHALHIIEQLPVSNQYALARELLQRLVAPHATAADVERCLAGAGAAAPRGMSL